MRGTCAHDLLPTEYYIGTDIHVSAVVNDALILESESGNYTAGSMSSLRQCAGVPPGYIKMILSR
ncbi:hypothetical protein BDW74DRAFT_147355, partial [Aspergillus multicolor]|uniref:uncharacterized protein n=1 Tax=Aspergillus multicolor TaxID=41759 RepID=UPI003CCD9C5B